MFPTHTPWFSLKILGLSYFSITHDNSLTLYIIRDVLDRVGKWFSHLWGFIIFSKPNLWANKICIPPNQFSFIRMYYYCNNLSIHWFNNQLFILHFFMWFSLFILLYIFRVHTCENYLNSKSYLLCFFFASRIFFYMVSENKVQLQHSWGTWSTKCGKSRYNNTIFKIPFL